MRTKITGALLLAALLLPAVSTFTGLQLRKMELRSQIKRKIINGIDKKDLVLLKFTPQEIQNELKWEHSREFEYLGCMYDIVSSETRGDTTYYWCWPDREETELNRRLTAMVNKSVDSDPVRQDTRNKLISFFSSLFFEENPYPGDLFDADEKNSYGFVINNYNSLIITPPSPPPRKS